MVVQHNLTAMNSNRMLGVTTKSQAKSTEKLSSGYKINRAADDAAGLAISEKMRRQIRGLTQASANAQDGISSVQTAEGALTEVHDMLQRMDELVTKASNGTMSENDRQNVQDEVDQLLTEIDRVAETTKFNEIYLLKGNAEGTESEKLINAHDAGLAGTLTDKGTSAVFTLKDELEIGSKINIAGKEYTIGNENTGSEGAIDKLKSTTEVVDTTNDDDFGNKQISFGDSIYDEDTNTTYTLVNKIQLTANGTLGDGITGNYALTSAKSEFKVIHADGTESTYEVNATAGSGKLSVADSNALIEKELKAGSTVILTKDKDGNSIANGGIEIVEELKSGAPETEVSIADAKFTDATKPTVAQLVDASGVTLAAKDTVTIDGETTTVTTNSAKSIDDLNSVIGKLKENDTVTISRTDEDGNTATKTYTVADTTNELADKYTVADIQQMIQDGDQVAITWNVDPADVTGGTAPDNLPLRTTATVKEIVVNNKTTTAANITSYHATETSESAASDSITKEKAYEMIAKELADASSIGTEEGKEATVVNNKDGSFTITKGKTTVADSLTFNLHVGADADMTNKIQVSIAAMDTAGLGLKGLNAKDLTGIAATYAIDAIEDAINIVSSQRSALGAVQNRLEHTINNVDNVVENTTSAESAIRDTDMATEMVKYSNNNILAQAGQAMLAQANQANQGVLSLLG